MAVERERVVVVGAGMAAARLVDKLVAHGLGSGITVLGDEPRAPYNRILLSAVLAGTHAPDALTLRSRDWYREHGVDLRLGARVLQVDTERRDVMLVDGTLIGWDRLVFATGSIPSLPPIRGLVGMDGQLPPQVHAFRSMADCRGLLGALRGPSADGGNRRGAVPQRAVVVGGGLLGLQVARALAVRGVTTEVVEGGEHLLHRQLDAQSGHILARHLRRLDTPVYTGVRAVRWVGPDPRSGGPDHVGAGDLVLDNGVHLSADLLVLTAGGRPAAGLARGAGLTVRRGIVVDQRLASIDDPAVHAIGDCAQFTDSAGQGTVHGFVAPAWEQADVLADILAGESRRYTGSRTVARLRANDLEVAVLGEPHTAVGEVVQVANPLAGTSRRLVVQHGRIVAASLVGDLRHVGVITQHFDRGTVLAPEEPSELLMPERPTQPTQLHDSSEVCSCAGVTAGAIRACTSFEQAVDTTRASTGCGGCSDAVRQLLAGRSEPHAGAPPSPLTADIRATA